MSHPVGQWFAHDAQWSQRAAALQRSPAADRCLHVLAHSGDSLWWLLGGSLLWWQTRATGGRELGRRIVLTTLAAGAASGVFKWVIRRPRPAAGAPLLHFDFDRHGFPSGHATRVGALAVALRPWLPSWARACLPLWGAAVGASRVLLGAHFLSDIAGGFLLGALIGWLPSLSGCRRSSR